MNTAQSVIYLCSCALNNKIPDPSLVQEMDLDAVYAFASKHMISATVAMTLESAGIKDQRSEKSIGRAVRKAVIFQNALQDISSRMEKEQIWHVPLKGSVLKEYYPKYGMREMSDIDILVDADRIADVRLIMEELGFLTIKYESVNHDIYHKEPVLNVEIHKRLLGSFHNDVFQDYFNNIQAMLDKSSYVGHFSPEDFYIYLIAHEYRHFAESGTGLRSLMDTYIYTKNVPLNFTYIAEEMGKLGIAKFEQSNRQLSVKIFEGERLTEKEQQMLDYFLSSGTYGTINNRVVNQLQRTNWSKTIYIFHRFFVPITKNNKGYADFADTYPVFYKYKFLLPFLPFYRILRAFCQGRFSAEMNALKKTRK